MTSSRLPAYLFLLASLAAGGATVRHLQALSPVSKLPISSTSRPYANRPTKQGKGRVSPLTRHTITFIPPRGVTNPLPNSCGNWLDHDSPWA